MTYSPYLQHLLSKRDSVANDTKVSLAILSLAEKLTVKFIPQVATSEDIARAVGIFESIARLGPLVDREIAECVSREAPSAFTGLVNEVAEMVRQGLPEGYRPNFSSQLTVKVKEVVNFKDGPNLTGGYFAATFNVPHTHWFGEITTFHLLYVPEIGSVLLDGFDTCTKVSTATDAFQRINRLMRGSLLETASSWT